MDVQTRSNLPLTIKQYVEMFTEQLTINEIEMILQESGDEDARYNLFYLIWSLKEAFIKAIGQGLGYDLLNVIIKSIFCFFFLFVFNNNKRIILMSEIVL